jgi:Protein of unknown function (DUF3500)
MPSDMKFYAIGAALALTLGLAACGSDSQATTGAGGSGTTTTAAGGQGGTTSGAATGATGGGGTGGGTATKDQACIDMVDAANAFLDSLDNDAFATATADFGAGEHTKFEFLPPLSAARDGLTMKALDPQQTDLLAALLQATMSGSGYAKLEAIRALESVLAMQESGVPVTENRDPDNYFIQIFGTPTVDGELPWGFRFEGHHLSLQTGVIDCELYSATPAFWGASPEITPLSVEVTSAQQLWDALDAGQQAMAQANVAASTPINIKDAKIDPLAAEGLPAGNMTAPQQMLLRQIIDAFLGNMNTPIAEQRSAAIEADDFAEVRFAFDGGNYRVLGPSFVIELVSAGNNHIHAVWRDYDGDYGDDLITQHMADFHP